MENDCIRWLRLFQFGLLGLVTQKARLGKGSSPSLQMQFYKNGPSGHDFNGYPQESMLQWVSSTNDVKHHTYLFPKLYLLKIIQLFRNYFSCTPHCSGHLFLVPSLTTIHTSHQSLEQMHWFEAIFKMFGRAVFEAIEVKGRVRDRNIKCIKLWYYQNKHKYNIPTEKINMDDFITKRETYLFCFGLYILTLQVEISMI